MFQVDKTPGDEDLFFVTRMEEKWRRFPHAVLQRYVDLEPVKDFKAREDDIFICG